jgi:site-specific DNA recombinase
MLVISYTRVSSEEQSRDGVSLAAQREKVHLYCDLHNLGTPEDVVDPGVSAKSLDRPGLSRALALLDSGEASGLVVYKLDRLTRSLADWSSLIDRYFGRPGGPSLMSVSESIDTRSASGRMVLNVMMTMAQWERETIIERTSLAMKFKRSRGERISGRLPFGSDLAADGRTLVDNPAERRALEMMRSWRAEGWGARRIAAELDALAVPTKGGPWSHSAVQSILARPD